MAACDMSLGAKPFIILRLLNLTPFNVSTLASLAAWTALQVCYSTEPSPNTPIPPTQAQPVYQVSAVPIFSTGSIVAHYLEVWMVVVFPSLQLTGSVGANLKFCWLWCWEVVEVVLVLGGG